MTAYVHSRRLGPDRPWDYIGRAKQLLASAHSVIDLGTGGGERFSELLVGYTRRAVATEEWHINAPVAAARLRPLGIDVVRYQEGVLPFAGESFDLVFDRHESLFPAEVARVLRPGGAVLTQQIPA